MLSPSESSVLLEFEDFNRFKSDHKLLTAPTDEIGEAVERPAILIVLCYFHSHETSSSEWHYP